MVLDFKQLVEDFSLLSKCGGKGSNLFKLKEKNFNVPEFVIIPFDKIEDFLNLESTLVSEYFSSLQDALPEEMISLWDEFVIKIKPKDLSALNIEIKEFIGENYLISVRSSVSSEDGKQTSFAGIFESVLDVTQENLEDAILRCISSLYHPNFYNYSLIHNLIPQDNKMSLIIQTMVKATISGVVFTMNPNGNYDDLIISAAKGSGVGVVNNTSEVTDFICNRQSHLWYESEGFCDLLSEKQLKELFDVAMRIELEMESPQDIEFSFDEDGKLWILQARPITTIDISNLKILDNSNIVESYPGITMPLSFSFARQAYKEVFTSAARLFMISEKKIKSIDEELSNMISHQKGRVYYNLHNWYKLIQMVISSENSLHAWETLIGLKSKKNDKNVFGVFKQIKTALVSLILLIRYPTVVRKFYKSFDVDYARFRELADKATNYTNREIYESYESISISLFSKWAPTILNDFFTFKSYDLLGKLCEKYTDDKTITNDLLCGLPGVESEILVKELLSIKDFILEDEELLKLFKLSDSDILKEVPVGLQKKIDDFVFHFGDRTLEELKLESPNFRMNPEGIIQLLRSQLDIQSSGANLIERQIKIRLSAEELVFEKQKGFLIKTLIFKLILKGTRIFIRNRENMRIRRTRAYGAVKELFYSISVQMQNEGLINDKKDIYYLKIEEVRDYCLSNKVKDFINLIEKRKQEYIEYESLDLPDRIVFNGEVPPIRNVITKQDDTSNKWYGSSISQGVIEAEAIVLDKPDMSKDVDGKILITKMTDPAWVFLMTRASGLISEKGSPLSHTAIVGRELGIPVLFGVRNATQLIKSGSRLILNCTEGFVERI